jgi:hypothetical protein
MADAKWEEILPPRAGPEEEEEEEPDRSLYLHHVSVERRKEGEVGGKAS